MADRTVEVLACPTCGMEREDWPDQSGGGYAKDGTFHCCKGCADGTGCTCGAFRAAEGERAPTREEIREDPASGDFVRSLDKDRKVVRPEDYGTDAITKAPARDSGPD
jgi:hypothetical protein